MLNELSSFEAQAAFRAMRHSKGHTFSRDEVERDRVIVEALGRRSRWRVILGDGGRRRDRRSRAA